VFSTEHTDRTETEVLVMLTPRVIRLPEHSVESAKGVAVEGGGESGPDVSPGQPAGPPRPPGSPE
jgi:hypothetical protein